MKKNERMLTVSGFCEELNLRKRKVYQDLNAGLISHHRVGRKILIPESSKVEYLGPIIGGDQAEQIAADVMSIINQE